MRTIAIHLDKVRGAGPVKHCLRAVDRAAEITCGLRRQASNPFRAAALTGIGRHPGNAGWIGLSPQAVDVDPGWGGVVDR